MTINEILNLNIFEYFRHMSNSIIITFEGINVIYERSCHVGKYHLRASPSEFSCWYSTSHRFDYFGFISIIIVPIPNSISPFV